ncbi:MAG TPA: SPFH domain-containing protein [Xanthomonadaceae bacterium]|jgi:regulator of protease activity HflC (stomatin/prohibitin superfamily)
MNERETTTTSGIRTLIVLFALLAGDIWIGLSAAAANETLTGGGAVLAGMLLMVCLGGFFNVEPNQAVVLSLFGKYVGSVREQGLRFTNPFYAVKKISLRIRNFETSKLKVNELQGSPIEIGAVIVWQVVDSAEAVYNVDDYESYVHIQSESALRQMATSYPYDNHDDPKTVSLRSHPIEISQHLMEQLKERLSQAGVSMIEARISHLAYAPEIAQAMLQRQQADAVVAARTRIVFGAVTMVEMALNQLKEKGLAELDDERRASMVSNMLVVLCSERPAQPIVNAGTIY